MNSRFFRCRLATTIVDLRRVVEKRYDIFARELEYIDEGLDCTKLEYDPWDLLPQTLHVLVEHEGVCIGTGRLIVGERRSDLGYGLPIESTFDIRSLMSRAKIVAEIGRICIEKRFRGQGAAQLLYSELGTICSRRGASLWVGRANCEVETRADANRIVRVITEQRLWSETRFSMRAATTDHPKRSNSYGASIIGNSLPQVLGGYVRYGNIRFAGNPTYDPRFRRYSIPFVGDPSIPQEKSGVGVSWPRDKDLDT